MTSKEKNNAKKKEEEKNKEETNKKNDEIKNQEKYAYSYKKAKEKWYYYNSTVNGIGASINGNSIIHPKSSNEKQVDGQIGFVSKNFIRVNGKRVNEASGVVEGSPTILTEKQYSNQSGVLSTYIKLSFLSDDPVNPWKEISTRDNKYIMSLEINDDGGGQKATINLIDRDFNEIDSYINKAIELGQQKKEIKYSDIANSASITTKNGGKLDAETIKSYHEIKFIEGVDGEYAKKIIADYEEYKKNLSSNSEKIKDTSSVKTMLEENEQHVKELLYNSRTNMDYISIVTGDNEPINTNLKIKFGYSDENYSGWSTASN